MSITHPSESPSYISQTFERMLGADQVCLWEQIPSPFQHQIQAALRPAETVCCVVYPQTPEELSEVVRCAHQNRWRILPCGRGTKLHWGGLTESIQVVVSTARMHRLIEHAVGDLTLTAEAGVRFAEVQHNLAQAQQFLALDPAYSDTATLGGLVATADAGSWRQRYGSVRDMLIGISFVRADGQLVKAGGRVVKNVAGYDLMKLLTGSYGTLGLISQLTFRVYPIPEASQSIVLTGAPEAIATATQTLLRSALTPTAADLLSPCLASSLNLGPNYGLLVRFQSIAVSVQQQIQQLQTVAQQLDLVHQIYAAAEESLLWKQLREKMASSPTVPAITCKIGVTPSKALSALASMIAETPSPLSGWIHAASGLGGLHLGDRAIDPQILLKLRTICESHGGFLTVLEAPSSMKQHLDIWGYSGNALALMKGIKMQFDPEQLFSPGRFVGGI